MSEYNSCSKLTQSQEFKDGKELYRSLLENGKDPLREMLQMQFDLQCKLTENRPIIPRPDLLRTLGDKFEWLRSNKEAFDDEYREIIDALGGMSNPSSERSAIWKRWKQNYESKRDETFDDLTVDDLVELKFELVDSFHFYMNMFFALELSPEELFVYYYAKNAENLKRSQNGY